MTLSPRVSFLGRVFRGSAAPSVALALLLAASAAYAEDPAPTWPFRVNGPEGQITIYQPQPTSFDGDRMKARAAVSLLKPGQTEPIFGAFWLESHVATDRATDSARIYDIVVTQARFADANGLSEKSISGAFGAVPAASLTMSLQQLQAMVELSAREKDATKAIVSDAPKIIVRDHPTVLVPFDGPPRLTQITNSSMLRVINTPFFIVLDSASQSFYLKGAGRWFAAGNAEGVYRSVNQVPANVVELAAGSGYTDPQEPVADAQGEIEIITATEPTEVIWSNGPAQYGPIPGTNLLYMTNTSSDVFLDMSTQPYLLISGRWYTSSAPNGAYRWSGPWVSVDADKLPADFAKVPANGPKSDVLVHVAGTQAAKDAVADSFVPQTAAIDRRNFQQPAVQYDGSPNFVPIQNTTMTYAINTPNSVIWCRGLYYCCSNAVWFVSPTPNGPWQLCATVPDDLYTIPASCPIFPVRYCRIYESSAEYVYVGYLPGYVGCYPHHGVVVWGTGYRYQPWVGRVYFPRPATFGFRVRYDSYSGHWGFNIGVSANAGPVWIGSSVPFANGWFGHGGYRPYEDHREQVRHGPPDPAWRLQTSIYDRRRDVRFEDRGPAWHGNDDSRKDGKTNQVYTDQGGNVYRRNGNGWEQRDHDKWIPRPAPVSHASDGPPSRGGDDRGKDSPPHDQPHAPEPGAPVRNAPLPRDPTQVHHGPVKYNPPEQGPTPAPIPESGHGESGHGESGHEPGHTPGDSKPPGNPGHDPSHDPSRDQPHPSEPSAPSAPVRENPVPRDPTPVHHGGVQPSSPPNSTPPASTPPASTPPAASSPPPAHDSPKQSDQPAGPPRPAGGQHRDDYHPPAANPNPPPSSPSTPSHGAKSDNPNNTGSRGTYNPGGNQGSPAPSSPPPGRGGGGNTGNSPSTPPSSGSGNSGAHGNNPNQGNPNQGNSNPNQGGGSSGSGNSNPGPAPAPGNAPSGNPGGGAPASPGTADHGRAGKN